MSRKKKFLFTEPKYANGSNFAKIITALIHQEKYQQFNSATISYNTNLLSRTCMLAGGGFGGHSGRPLELGYVLDF